MPSAKTKRINVRVSAEDHDALAAMARAEGLGVSDYVRRRCLKEETRPKLVVNEDLLRQVYANHRRAAGLLNQAMFAINRQHAVTGCEQQLAEALEATTRSTEAVADFIAKINYYL